MITTITEDTDCTALDTAVATEDTEDMGKRRHVLQSIEGIINPYFFSRTVADTDTEDITTDTDTVTDTDTATDTTELLEAEKPNLS